MTRLGPVRSFLRALLFRRRVEHEIDADLRFHLAERIDDLIGQGLSRSQAERQARRELGDPAKWIEEGREARGTQYVDEFHADVRYALRWLRRSPAFTATAVLSLAIGIGANAAIFNLLDVVLLRSLPVRNPDELVVFTMRSASAAPMRAFWSRMFRQMEQSNESLAGMLAVSMTRFSVQTANNWYPIARGQMASGSYYGVLGVPAALGRTLLPDDDGAPGTGAVAVLSHGYWRHAFGQDPNVVGRMILLNGVTFTIIGVSAAGFFGTQVGESVDVTVPLSMEPVVMAEPERRPSSRGGQRSPGSTSWAGGALTSTTRTPEPSFRGVSSHSSTISSAPRARRGR